MTAGASAARLRVFSHLHAREAGLILDELTDVRSTLDEDAGDHVLDSGREHG